MFIFIFMKIVILGSGNVAFHLAKAFKEKNIAVSQIFGRNENALKEISEKFSIPYSTHEVPDADLYLISVSDDSVADISKGNAAISRLSRASSYPRRSRTDSRRRWRDDPLHILISKFLNILFERPASNCRPFFLIIYPALNCIFD